MANPEHLAILKKGVKEWNAWREANPDIRPELSGADLSSTNLSNANLSDADIIDTLLSYADLSSADLRHAYIASTGLMHANLIKANLGEANLSFTDLSSADLRHADLSDAYFSSANFSGANCLKSVFRWTIFSQTEFNNTDFKNAELYETMFINVNLQGIINLDQVRHTGPSSVDYRSIMRSWPIPEKFLQGVGFPDNWIEYFPSLLYGPHNKPIQFYTCFISYSRKDDEFAERLYADLQNKGIRCWKDTHDLDWGAKTRKVIDQEIRRRDKVILVLSEHSMTSDWVEHEVDLTLDEELRRKKNILIPFRIDDAVMDTDEEWAASLRSHRNFGDFRGWEDHKTYKKSFELLLKHLKSDK
ncbi:toll/interleukin-1 receptor domain-containing protein [Calditrichota bacterium]